MTDRTIGRLEVDRSKTGVGLMIKVAVTFTDKATEAQLLNCLHGEKDIRVKGSIVIPDVVRDVDKALAFLDKMVKSPPDVIHRGRGYPAGSCRPGFAARPGVREKIRLDAGHHRWRSLSRAKSDHHDEGRSARFFVERAF